MKTKMMIQGALLGVMAILATSCFSNDDYKTEYDSHLVIMFEPQNDYEWPDFADQFFPHDEDTVFFAANISQGPVYFFAVLDGQKAFQGGMALCRGKDADASGNRDASYFAVYDAKGGNQGSRAYAVFHDAPATQVPEHFIQIYFPNELCTCGAESMYVHNVQAVVQAAKYGVGLADGPFQDDDYLLLTVTGRKGVTVSGTKEVKLVDGTSYLKEWTKVDLSDLGSVDAVDFKLTSSRADFPLYCCLDDFMVHYVEIYK